MSEYAWSLPGLADSSEAGRPSLLFLSWENCAGRYGDLWTSYDMTQACLLEARGLLRPTMEAGEGDENGSQSRVKGHRDF